MTPTEPYAQYLHDLPTEELAEKMCNILVTENPGGEAFDVIQKLSAGFFYKVAEAIPGAVVDWLVKFTPSACSFRPPTKWIMLFLIVIVLPSSPVQAGRT